MKQIAQQQALDLYREAVRGLFTFIDRRIEWSWNNASMLALRAQRMVFLLATDPGRVPFRRLKIRWWRWRERVYSAKAWATEPVIASACELECRRG